MQATISGRCCQTICSLISIDSCFAPSAFATVAACSRSSAAPGASKPAVNASTGWLFSRAIKVSRVALSMPPDRNMPYGTSLR